MNAQQIKNVYNEFAQNVIKKRLDVKLDKDAILWEGLFNYGKYGAKNPNNDIESNVALTQLDANTLSGIIHQLPGFKHKIFYYGQNDIEVVRTTSTSYTKQMLHSKTILQQKYTQR